MFRMSLWRLQFESARRGLRATDPTNSVRGQTLGLAAAGTTTAPATVRETTTETEHGERAIRRDRVFRMSLWSLQYGSASGELGFVFVCGCLSLARSFVFFVAPGRFALRAWSLTSRETARRAHG